MTPELKYTVKTMIRDAIRWQNQQVLFTCRQCCFYTCSKHNVQTCGLNKKNQLVLAKRMPTQMPECFMLDPLDSALAAVLGLMYSLGVNTDAKHGWATVVSRLTARADRCGYITGVMQKNLERYGN